MKHALALALIAALSGCGGGGGGGSTIREVPFTSFSAVKPNETVVMTGISQTVSGSQTTMPGAVNVTSVNPDPVNIGNTTVKLTYDGSRDLAGIDISTPQSSVSFQRSQGHTVICGGINCLGSKPNTTGEAANSFHYGWNYQSFGMWLELVPPGSYRAGAASVGVVTPGAAVPAMGTATFTGAAQGYFFESSSGTPYITRANVTADVNFGARSIAFNTSGTVALNTNAGGGSASPTLNMGGTLTYDPGSNQFAGTLTSGNGLSGSSTGRFYGPNAEELGGVYSLSGAAGSMVGGYGGRRP